jgi:hypothetical protein
MKTNQILIAILSGVVLASCGAKKQPKMAYATPTGEVEVLLPCSGTDFRTDDKFYRATQSGTSQIIDQALNNAIAAVKERLASDIYTDVKTVTDRYNNSTQAGNRMNNSQKTQGLSRQISEASLKGSRTICEKMTRITEEGPMKGYYRVYIAQEVPVEILLEEINSALSSDEELKVNFDYENFKNEYMEEFEKRKNSSPNR